MQGFVDLGCHFLPGIFSGACVEYKNKYRYNVNACTAVVLPQTLVEGGRVPRAVVYNQSPLWGGAKGYKYKYIRQPLPSTDHQVSSIASDTASYTSTTGEVALPEIGGLCESTSVHQIK